MNETYLVAYDINNSRRLQKIGKIAEDYGIRMQRSIFEAQMTEISLKEMKRRMAAVMDPAEDGVKIFLLCASCEAKRTGAGKNLPSFPDKNWQVL